MENDNQGKKQLGRPKVKSLAREHQAHVYFQNADQLQLVQKAAELAGLGVTAWCRSVLLREARKIVNEYSPDSLRDYGNNI